MHVSPLGCAFTNTKHENTNTHAIIHTLLWRSNFVIACSLHINQKWATACLLKGLGIHRHAILDLLIGREQQSHYKPGLDVKVFLNPSQNGASLECIVPFQVLVEV